MDQHVKISGVWKRTKAKHVKIGGVAKTILRGYTKVAGDWKQFFSNAAPILSGSSGSPNQDNDFVVDPGTAQAGWVFSDSGDLTKFSGSSWNVAEWFGRASDTVHTTPDQTYYIRATLDSGSAPSTGPALAAWHALTTSRTWKWDQTGIGTAQGSIQVDIASDAAGTTIVATGYYQGTAEVTV